MWWSPRRHGPQRPQTSCGIAVAFCPGAGHATLPVHRILLVEAGIHIMEVMNLTELAAAGVGEFLFVAAPLKLVGATGSPTRPLAIIDG